MAKKYSVNVENDEVVSIEVDGVQYASPDDIPDEMDRDKILDLIEKTSRDEFDQEFEAEFNKMQKQSAGTPKVIVTIFGAIGVLMLIIALISTVSTVRSLAREASSPGQVVDMTVRQSYDSETRITSEYYYPVVQFKTANGSSKRVQLSEGSWPPEYEVGQPVTVLYDPEKPLDARIKSASSTVLKWILPGVTGIVGAVFLGFSYMIYRFLQ